jgi:hypothetical protein
MSKFNTLTQREVINPETGELTTIETSKTFTTKISEDQFYMTFVKFLSPLYDIRPERAKDLLTWMLEHAEFNTGIVQMPAAVRRQICVDLEITNNSITNYLKVLKDKKLISGEGGTFKINPQIFWKGELAARKRLLKDKSIQITFGIED